MAAHNEIPAPAAADSVRADVVEREAMTAYADVLRKIVVRAILGMSKGGFQGTADRYEDALDRADAIVGRGPYAGL